LRGHRHQVVQQEPQASGIAEERERDQRTERHRDRELPGERQPDGPVEREHDAHRDRKRQRVVKCRWRRRSTPARSALARGGREARGAARARNGPAVGDVTGAAARAGVTTTVSGG